MENLKLSLSNLEIVKTKLLIALVVLGASAGLQAGGTLEYNLRTAGPSVHAAFEQTREFLQTSSAVFKRGRDEIIFGTVVSPDGYILTKASELGELDEVTVTVDRERYSQPKLVAEDPAWDLALVKIDAQNLVPVAYRRGEEIERGSWVVANGATTRKARRVQVGVVAANTRAISASGGTVLGVALEDDKEQIKIKEVTEGTGAEKGGLLAGDIIVSLDGNEVAERKEMIEILGEKNVGDIIPVGITRDGEAMELEIELAGRADVFGEKKTRNDSMSGAYSERRTGFPRVMQHDIMGNRSFMGGPVFNLDGECVGMNIARFNRCETYAIPAKDLEELAKRMMEEAAP